MQQGTIAFGGGKIINIKEKKKGGKLRTTRRYLVFSL